MTGPQITKQTRPDWHTKAACRGLNPDLFYGETSDHATDAKAVCATCPVRQECLDWAVTTVETHGIWGGKSEKERKSLRRALNTGTGPCPGCGGPSTQAWNQSRAALCVDCRRARQRAAAARHRVSRAGELA